MVSSTAVIAHLTKQRSSIMDTINTKPENAALHKHYTALMSSITELRLTARSLRFSYSNRRITKEILANVNAVSDDFITYENYLGYTVKVALPLLTKIKHDLTVQVNALKTEKPELVAHQFWPT